MRSINSKRICESCGAIDGGGNDKKLLECAGCLSSYFCNTQCQQQSWPLHKKICRQRKKSVVKIQSNWRGWYTRRQLVINDGQDRCEVCGVLDSKDKQLNICNGCKLSLFCSVRCQEYAWKKKNHKIICLERQMNIQVKSVVTIQSSWRGYMCRLAITKYKERAVLKIQTAWKAYMKVKRDKIRLEKQISKKLHKKSKQRAALKIQSAWRATYPTAITKKGALQILFSPDGYYKYLGVPRTTSNDIIENQVSRNYRILSKHYTKQADAEVRDALSRAKKVLIDPRLRDEYDMVGLDLEKFSEYYEDEEELVKSLLVDGIIYEICEKLWSIFISIAMMVLATTVSSHMILVIPLLFLLGMSFLGVASEWNENEKEKKDLIAYVVKTLTLVLGICCMYKGQGQPLDWTFWFGETAVKWLFDNKPDDTPEFVQYIREQSLSDTHAHEEATGNESGLFWTFWLGESIVMWCINLKNTEKSPRKLFILFTITSILSWWLQGRLWRYGILTVMNVIITVLVFLVGYILDAWTDRIVEREMARGRVHNVHNSNVEGVSVNVNVYFQLCIAMILVTMEMLLESVIEDKISTVRGKIRMYNEITSGLRSEKELMKRKLRKERLKLEENLKEKRQ